MHIPVIDFSNFLRARSYEQKKPTADAVVSAFKDSGFIYLKNYGIPDSTIADVYAKVRNGGLANVVSSRTIEHGIFQATARYQGKRMISIHSSLSHAPTPPS